MFTWLTVLLYIVSTLGIAALTEEGEDWFAESSPGVETIATAPFALASQPEQPAGSPSSGDSGSQPEDQQPATPPDEDGDQDFWQDLFEWPDDWDEWLEEDDCPSVCRVLFITPGGHILLDYDAAPGTAVANPNLSPALKGHTFSHWYQVGCNPNTSFAFGGPLEGDLTLAAFFTEVAKAEQGNQEEPEEPGEEEGLEEGLEEAESLAPIQVEITSDAGSTVYFGDRVTLTAHVAGRVQGETFSMWCYNAGSGWMVAATNTLTHSFVVDESNCLWKWEYRITVTVGGAD